MLTINRPNEVDSPRTEIEVRSQVLVEQLAEKVYAGAGP